MVKELGLRNNVVFTGFRQDIPRIMKEIDIFVHSSLKEPFGMAIVEAMAAGKPIIASGVSGPLEIVINGVTGLLVKPGDVNGLAMAIEELLDEEQKAEMMGRKARERVIELFDLKKNICQIDEYCENLLRGR